MEGTEVRIGPVASATWAAITTSTSNGSVNSMHDSLNPIAGMVPMSLMMLNVVFSGIAAGFLNMFAYIIIAVFIAGLMVGRTPEYLGKKVEAKEVKLAMLAVLIHPFVICMGTAIFAATSWKAFCANPEEKVASFRQSLEPMRATLQGQLYLGGESPNYADYIVFGAFQWARCTSPATLLAEDDPVFAWRRRLLDAYDGLGGKSLGYAG